jgi:hypothetical protein
MGGNGCQDLSQGECEESPNGCGWTDDGHCVEYCDDCECAMYSDPAGCDSHDNDGHNCYWEDNLCHDEDSGPPECIFDCPDFQTLFDFFELGEGDLAPDEICTIFSSWDGESCLSDCSDEVCDDCDDSDLEEIMEMIGECSECLAADNCEGMFDGPPECMLDCEDLEAIAVDPVDVGQYNYCNDLVAFDQSCLSDCDQDTMDFVAMMIFQCEDCLENDNCECLFVDEVPEGCDDGDDCDNDEDCSDDDSCIEGQCYTPCENGDDCDDEEDCCDAGQSECEPGFCYEEGPMFPECVMDCSGADQATNAYMYYNGDGFCTILAGWYGDLCLDDCGVQDFAEVNMFIGYCTDCLDADNCGQPWGCDDENGTSWYSYEEECEANCETECYDSSGGNDDDGPPECIFDCPDFEVIDNDGGVNTPDEFCTILAGWYGDSCLDDCDAYNLAGISEFIGECVACLEADNCEDLWDEGGECESCHDDCNYNNHDTL